MAGGECRGRQSEGRQRLNAICVSVDYFGYTLPLRGIP